MAPIPSEGNKALLLNLTLMPDDLTEQQVETIERYTGISGGYLARQLLVPENMKLHSLHYAIQAAFGWLNQSPHHYSLQQGDFDRVTYGKFAEWRDLVGVFFRAPDAPQESYYPSDTPPANQTYKFWLRNRYRGPYEWDSGTFFEHLVSSRLFLNSLLEPEGLEELQPAHNHLADDDMFGFEGFMEDVPGVSHELGEFGAQDELQGTEVVMPAQESIPLYSVSPDYDSMSTQDAQQLFRDDIRTLLERIPLGQLLVPYDLPKATAREIDRKIGRADAAFAVGQHITYPITVEMSEHASQYDEEHTPLDVLELQDRYERVLAETDTAALPIANGIDYFYGPNDDWHVRVDCEEIYEMQGYTPGTWAADDFYPIRDQTGREVPQEAHPTVSGVILENRPVCTAVSGPNVLDNVNGPAGYAVFLDALFGRQPQARLDAARTAREQGWSRHAPDANQVL